MSQSYGSVRLTFLVLDSFASCETDSLLKFQDEETSSVCVMDIVSGTEQYLLLYH